MLSQAFIDNLFNFVNFFPSKVFQKQLLQDFSNAVVMHLLGDFVSSELDSVVVIKVKFGYYIRKGIRANLFLRARQHIVPEFICDLLNESFTNLSTELVQQQPIDALINTLFIDKLGNFLNRLFEFVLVLQVQLLRECY